MKPLQSSLLNQNDRLRQVSGGGPPMRELPLEIADPDAVQRLQTAMNSLGFKGSDGQPLKVDGKYGPKTAAAVRKFQQSAFPGNPQQADGRLGPLTIDKLDDALGSTPQFRPLLGFSISEDVLPNDILVFITGVADDAGLGGVDLTGRAGPEAAEFSRVPPRAGFGKRFKAFGGSLQNSVGVAAAVAFIEAEFTANAKVILYGYSAGAKQLLDVCARIETLNVARKAVGIDLIQVNLLVTNDAAAKADTPNISRVVAGCVLNNLNEFQLVAGSTINPLQAPGSHGGPNTGAASKLTGNTPKIINFDMTLLALIAMKQFSEQQLRFVSPHAAMQTLAHPGAMSAIRKEMAS